MSTGAGSPPELSRGDKVRLARLQGPVMTVLAVTENLAICEWLEGRVERRYPYRITELERVDGNPNDTPLWP